MQAQPCSQQGSLISRLTQQLLIHVLECVGVQHTLQSCALVCKAWRTAAKLSVHDIQIAHCTPEKAAALHTYLEDYDTPVTVHSLDIHNRDSSAPIEMWMYLFRAEQFSKLHGIRLTKIQIHSRRMAFYKTSCSLS